MNDWPIADDSEQLIGSVTHAVDTRSGIMFVGRGMHLRAVVERLRALEGYRAAVIAELYELDFVEAARYLEGRKP